MTKMEETVENKTLEHLMEDLVCPAAVSTAAVALISKEANRRQHHWTFNQSQSRASCATFGQEHACKTWLPKSLAGGIPENRIQVLPTSVTQVCPAVFTVPSTTFVSSLHFLLTDVHPSEDVNCCCSARSFLSHSSRSLQHRSMSEFCLLRCCPFAFQLSRQFFGTVQSYPPPLVHLSWFLLSLIQSRSRVKHSLSNLVCHGHHFSPTSPARDGLT